MGWIGIVPGQIQNRIRKLPALFFVQVTNTQKNLRDDVLVEAGITGRGHGSILPRDPARRVRHASVFFGEAGAGQPVHRSLDVLLFVGSGSWSTPELAGLVGIDFA